MIVKIAHYNFFLLLFLCLFLISCDDLLNYSDLEYSNDSELNSEKGFLKEYYKMLEKRKLSFGLLRQDGGGDDGNLGDDVDETSNVDFPSVNIENPDNWVDVVNPVDTGTPPTTNATFSVTADKSTVKEGEFVTFTIVASNVAAGTPYDYVLFGDNITPSDLTSNTLKGTFVVENFGDYSAKVVIGIKVDADLSEQDETLIFAISGTGAQASVIISSDLTGLSDQDKLDFQNI